MIGVAPAFATVARRTARVLSGLILAFWGWFLVAHFVGDAGRPSRAITVGDFALLMTLLVSLGGLALAWKWERAGGVVALVAITACAALNWRVLVFPGALIPTTAALYLSSWWLRRDRHADGLNRRPIA